MIDNNYQKILNTKENECLEFTKNANNKYKLNQI